MSALLSRASRSMQQPAAHRLQALSMYRQLLRTARALPSHNHRGVATAQARALFRANRGLSGAEAEQALALAETQLDNLRVQAGHMRDIMGSSTLTHDAPKPSRLYAPKLGSAAPARSFHSSAVRASTGGASPFAAADVSLASDGSGSWMGMQAGSTTAPSSGLNYEEQAQPVHLTASHIVHVLLTPNNTIVTLTTLNGDCKAWASSGTAGFKNAKKSTYMACIAAGEQLGHKAKNQNIHNVDLHISGFHKNKKAVLKGIMKAGLNIVAIRDTTPIPFNGCKPKKQRRL